MFTTRTGTIITLIVGGVSGGLLFSKNFTIRKGEWFFSTHDDEHSFRRLEESYETRVKYLKETSTRSLQYLKSSETTKMTREQIIRTTIGSYLTPTSHDNLFGKDIVLFNGYDNPTIISREDFNDIQNNWKRVLAIAGIRTCVDKYVIDQVHSGFESKIVEDACTECLNSETLTIFLNTFPEK